MKILVVEDDLLVADALRTTLTHHKYAVEIAHDGRSALDFIEAFDYDLLLLDVILPRLDGISICRHVRSQGYTMPILLLTSKDSNHDRAIGLDAGADDYAIKPFDPEELSARIRALLRRGKDNVRPVLNWEDLTLDPRNYEVTYQHQLLNLTPKEYALLELFLRHNRQLFSCGAILEHLWTYEDTPSEEAVRTHIKGLRHKLKAAGAPADLVETVYGIGYRLKPHESSSDRQSNGDREIDSILSPPDPAVPNPMVANTVPASKRVTAKEHPQFLTEIWNRHQSQLRDRLDTIDLAIQSLDDRSINAQIRRQAWQSAHTLAGTLGTFGLPLGSQVAKQIELLLDEKTELTSAHISQLQSGVDRLRLEIASKSTTTPTQINSSSTSLAPWLLVISRDREFSSSLQDVAASRFEIVSAIELIPAQLSKTPAAIVLDLDCFPHIADGLAALSALDRDYPHLPAIVLSQSHSSTDTKPAENIAAEDAERLCERIEVARRGGRLFLSKPTSTRQVLGAIDRVLQQVRVSQARVMIVDDDRLLLEGVAALLSLQGMTVTTLSEPSRFWKTLEATAPDLLILDLDMPMHDGIELCRAVRTDSAWTNLPILFLTAHSASLASDRVFAAGADDFVTKPVVEATLVTRILNRLERIGLQGLR
jgi:DNA-binding response OmpR family regulator/HPt (histidine-containing phosphotransfer) domain-containing protein